MADLPDMVALRRLYLREMSQGDRSCVAMMVQRPGAVQATTADSAHCRFYERLAAAGWARRDTASALTAAAPFIRVWALTDLGQKRLADLLPSWADG